MESFGLSFYDIEDKRVRCFRVVFPRHEPYEPRTKEEELSRIAKQGMRDDENFMTIASKHPRRTPEGRYIQSFGAGYLVPSVKNFVIEDRDGKVIFMLYKASNDTCTLKLRPPLSLDVGFAIALAVTSSSR